MISVSYISNDIVLKILSKEVPDKEKEACVKILTFSKQTDSSTLWTSDFVLLDALSKLEGKQLDRYMLVLFLEVVNILPTCTHERRMFMNMSEEEKRTAIIQAAGVFTK